MRTSTSVAEQPEQDIVGVRTIRDRNRADQKREEAIANVGERLEVYGVLATTSEIHPKVRREQATAIVDAVMALTAPRPEVQ